MSIFNLFMRAGSFIIAYFFILSLHSQKYVEPGKLTSFNITVNHPDHTIKTQMLKDAKKITPHNSLTYYWYQSQKIMETKGGFDGKLLHGYYKSFYLNDQLKETGTIHYGLKNKEWKYWYPDGKIKEIITWKRGRKRGTYKLYNDYGQLMARGHFKNDLLNGRFYTYDNTGKIVERKKYKNGIEIINKKKIKPQKQKKEKIRKEKKTKDTKTTSV